MKSNIFILKLVFLCLFIAVIGANVGPFVEVLEDRRDEPSFLSTMRDASKTKEFKTTKSIYKESAIISDVSFLQNEKIDLTENFKSELNGIGAIRVEIPYSSNKKDFGLRFVNQPSIKGSFEIYDQYQRLIAVCAGSDCYSLRFSVAGDSSIILIQAKNHRDLTGQVFLERLSKFELVNVLDEIPTIDLNLSDLGLHQLNHLVETAKLRARMGSMDIPRQKIKGLVKCCRPENISVADVRVGLSGRGGGHFGVFPPSISVSVVSGQPILGARRFKLIRPEMRHGLSEMVLSSILKDFGLPVQSLNLVVLKLNGQIAGLHYFEEGVSSTFFENNKLNEGYIFGYNRDQFFKPKTPFLKEEILFAPTSKSQFREVNFTGDDFFSKIDKAELTLITSFLSFFTGTHGLGADDLKFYEDPITGVFEPFSRDYKVGAWPINAAGNGRSLNSHLSFHTMATPPSVAAIFGDLSTMAGYNTESLGVWDVHPTVKKLMGKAEYRLLYEKHILDLMENDFLNLFTTRLKRAADKVLSLDVYDTPTKYDLVARSRIYLQNELENIQDTKNFSLASLLTDSIKTRPPIIFKKQGRWFLLNGLPFSLRLSATSPNCKLSSGKTLVGPLTGVTELKPVTLKVAAVIQSYIDSSGVNYRSGYYSPLCELNLTEQELSNLHIELPNGRSIKPFTVKNEDETTASHKVAKNQSIRDDIKLLKNFDERSFVYSDGSNLKISHDQHRFISLEKYGNEGKKYIDGRALNLKSTDNEISQMNIKIKGQGYSKISVVTKLDLDLLSNSLKRDKEVPDNSSILSIVYEGVEAKVEFFGYGGVTGGAAPNRVFRLNETGGLVEIQLTFEKNQAALIVNGKVIDSWQPSSSGGPNMIRLGDYNATLGSNSHMRMDYVGIGINTSTGSFYDENNKDLTNNFREYVAVVPHDYIDNPDHVIISYAMHMTDNLLWNKQSLALRSQGLGGVTSVMGTPFTAYEVKANRDELPSSNMEFFNAFNDNRYELFGANSVVFSFKIEKTQENQFFEIKKDDVAKLVKSVTPNQSDSAIPYTLILDSKSHEFANFVPSMDKIEQRNNVNQQNIIALVSEAQHKLIKNSFSEIEFFLNNLENEIVTAAHDNRSRQYGKKLCAKSNSVLITRNQNQSLSDAVVKEKSNAILHKTPLTKLLKRVRSYQSEEEKLNDIKVVHKPIMVKEGEVLRIRAGETWLMGREASIQVNGTLIIEGSITEPVILAPLDEKWPGLIIRGAHKQHMINNSLLIGVASSAGRFGAISLEKSSLNINNSILIDFDGIDGINAHKSHLNISESIFGVTKSDVIDADFSYGEIRQSLFFKSDGDYIDVNQSKFLIEENVLINSFKGFGLGDPDKGISCGEKSFCDIKRNTFQNLTFGVAVKDGSFADVSDNYFSANMLGVAAFVKKPWFGKEFLEISENAFNDNCENHANLGELRY